LSGCPPVAEADIGGWVPADPRGPRAPRRPRLADLFDRWAAPFAVLATGGGRNTSVGAATRRSPLAMPPALV